MTRNELMAECKRRAEGGEDVEAVIGYLRTSGCSKIDSIAVLNGTYGIGLAKAKETIHFSPMWSDAKALDEKFHQEIIDTLTKKEG